MKDIRKVLNYLKKEELILTTAESCTAGRITHLLAKIAGSGDSLEAGYVVYSIDAKKRLLQVKQTTINKYTVSSEEVAREMVIGAFKNSKAKVVVATTGVAGPKAMDGVPPGTVCFGWGFRESKKIFLYSATKHFEGTRIQVLTKAAKYALMEIPKFHQLIRCK